MKQGLKQRIKEFNKINIILEKTLLMGIIIKNI